MQSSWKLVQKRTIKAQQPLFPRALVSHPCQRARCMCALSPFVCHQLQDQIVLWNQRQCCSSGGLHFKHDAQTTRAVQEALQTLRCNDPIWEEGSQLGRGFTTQRTISWQLPKNTTETDCAAAVVWKIKLWTRDGWRSCWLSCSICVSQTKTSVFGFLCLYLPVCFWNLEWRLLFPCRSHFRCWKNNSRRIKCRF